MMLMCAGTLAALIKVCLAMEHGTLPGNLHYSEPNPHNASLVSGILQVSASTLCFYELPYSSIKAYNS